ncbi:Zinc finger MYM-type protein 1 [Linum perenne]
MKQPQSIQTAFCRQSDEAKKDYRTRLEASLNCIKFLLHNGLPFRGHDESEFSSNKGCFSELLEFHARDRDSIQCVVLENAPQNQRMTSPDIQKDIVHARIRGQGYDGASNMKGEINGLKSLILAENPSAHYVHCFAHQLQLTLVAVAKNHCEVSYFVNSVSHLINVVGSSCKRQDSIKEHQAAKVAATLANGELETGRGLNQEMSLKRPCETSWGSHFGTLINLASIFSSVIEVLDDMLQEGTSETKAVAYDTLLKLQSFSFSFMLNLMIKVLAITNELSIALQRKDQDIVNAIQLVRVAKLRLQGMRDQGWELLFHDAVLFCNKENIHVPSMNDVFVLLGRPRRNSQQVTNLHHYQVEVFYTAVDM